MTTSDMSRHSAPAIVSPYYKNGSLKNYVTNNDLPLGGRMDLVSDRNYCIIMAFKVTSHSYTKLPVVWISCIAVRLSTETSNR